MKRILIIEDDPLIASIYQQKFNLEGFLVDIAADGKQGIDLIETRKHNLVLLDLMLPKMSGVELLKIIRQQPDLRFLPIVVFSNCHLTNMVEEAKKAGATQILTKANHTPRQVVEIVCAILAGSTSSSATGAIHSPSETPAAEVYPSVQVDQDFQNTLQRNCQQTMPDNIVALQRLLQTFLKNKDDLILLHELYLKVRFVATSTGLAGLPAIARLATALEALLRELYEKNHQINPSVLRTIVQGMDLLMPLLRQSLHPSIRHIGSLFVMVTAPDEGVLHSLSAALEKASIKSILTRSPDAALHILNDNTFDLFLINFEMPDMPGFELYSKIRALTAHQKTPAILMSPLPVYQKQLSSCSKAGCELIATPFLGTELVVKALTLIFKNRIS